MWMDFYMNKFFRLRSEGDGGDGGGGGGGERGYVLKLCPAKVTMVERQGTCWRCCFDSRPAICRCWTGFAP